LADDRVSENAKGTVMRAAQADITNAILEVQKPGTPTAWVFGASVNGLSFVRSLGRRGIPSVLFDADRLVGAGTRFSRFVLLPPVEKAPATWLEVLVGAARRMDTPPVALVTSDAAGVFFTHHASELAPHIRFVLPAPDALAAIVNKRLQYARAAEADVPIPETHFPESLEEVEDLAWRMSYPRILKPCQSHVGRALIDDRKVLVLESPEHLIREYAALGESGSAFMVQEIIPGGDNALYGYLAFWDAQQREVAWLTKRKLRQSPPRFGDGSLQMVVEDPGIADLSRRLLKAFRYRGFVGVEFKQDPRDGRFKLMEINPRTVSGNQMTISAGVDFPYIGYRALTGDPIPAGEVGRAEPGTKYINEEWDLKAFVALRKEGALSFGQWVQSIRGCKARALWAWDDPAPALDAAGRIVAAGIRKVFNRGSPEPPRQRERSRPVPPARRTRLKEAVSSRA
jgi:predicted ATP-grasp superfamily ATP-dependent carboligase